MEDRKMTKKLVTTNRRIYRVTYYPKKWYRKAKLEIRKLGVKGTDELVCRFRWDQSVLLSAYSSNSRLLDIICENDKFFLERFMMVNLDSWTDSKNPAVQADMKRGEPVKRLK